MFRAWNPPNRFDPVEIEWDEPPPPARLQVMQDDSQQVLTHNDSPDIPFSWSVNPYRGCTHACSYCYARPFHEYLGLGAGSDWERVIVVKPRAPELLEQALRRPSWKGEPIAMSGITDCYQPLERRWRLTRGCLEVLLRYRNPVQVVTRSPLITRDLDLLGPLASFGAATVSVSLPILDPETCRLLEPGAPPPGARLAAISALAQAGVPVGVSVSPVVPGLTDREIPGVLAAARRAGATWAWMLPLRLPGAVADVFLRRLRAVLPDAADKVERRLRESKGGALNRSGYGERFEGQGAHWQATRQLFEVHLRRLGYSSPPATPDPSPFRVPGQGVQAALFAPSSGR